MGPEIFPHWVLSGPVLIKHGSVFTKKIMWDFLHHIYSGDNWWVTTDAAVPVCGRSGLWPFRFVAVSVCDRFGLWPFLFVAVPVCSRSGLWPFRSVAVPVCGRFGLWPFRLWPFRFVAVMTCYHLYIDLDRWWVCLNLEIIITGLVSL